MELRSELKLTDNIKQEIPIMLDVFMANSYLVPSTHTDYLHFTNSEEQYMTYANDRRDYFSYEIQVGGKRIFSGTASKHYDEWSISGDNLLTGKSSKKQLETHYKYIKAIYDEVHSLDISRTRIKELRSKIAEKKRQKENIDKEIATLQQEIKDSKLIIPKVLAI